MQIKFIRKYIEKITLNNMNIGQEDIQIYGNLDAVDHLINMAIIKIYTEILLLIDDVSVKRTDNATVVLGNRFTGKIIDIIDNMDGRDYFVGREDGSTIPIHQMGYNKFVIDWDNISEYIKDKVGGNLEVTFFYSVYPEYKDTTDIPDVLINAIEYFVRWQVSVMQPKTSISTIDRYKNMFEEEIYNLKQSGVEIEYVPRSHNLLFNKHKSFSFGGNKHIDNSTIYNRK